MSCGHHFMSYSSVMSILWFLLESPDLAITEAAVGAGVTSLLFLPHPAEDQCPEREWSGMKTDPARESWYERFLRWAEGRSRTARRWPEDPARQEFWSIWSTWRPTETWTSGPTA